MVSNPTQEYNDFIRANLPTGITYDSVRARYVTENGKYFPTYLQAKWYLDYIKKFGYSPFILDRFTGAAAAYSLRQLSKSTTNVVRVRRESDNDETDFTAEQINSGTLLDFTGTGASAAGYVPLWYDQSGNAKHAPQTTAASQPKIVDGGVLVTENGKAAVSFDATVNLVNMDIPETSASCLVAVTAVKENLFFLDGLLGSYFFYDPDTNRVRWRFPDTTSFSFDTPATSNATLLFATMTFEDNSPMFAFKDGEPSPNNPINRDILEFFRIGEDITRNNFNLQELILYPSDQSANRTDIEANIADYYGITLA